MFNALLMLETFCYNPSTALKVSLSSIRKTMFEAYLIYLLPQTWKHLLISRSPGSFIWKTQTGHQNWVTVFSYHLEFFWITEKALLDYAVGWKCHPSPPQKIHVHLEPQNMTLRNTDMAYTIKERLTWDHTGLEWALKPMSMSLSETKNDRDTQSRKP